ncbi:penicillin-binding transpeptidase domain-containing protein [Stigmatella sp. ncwal1]|uniref:Penicillin-binding transpeptidase domain-containing protein n=1 Tax=Stigmatella ashevillensis TaxID=2995309 RepID=A0ABT5D154_9BACT|nr:penicillin-binding transpeptidase domain-containing protein [Stigmatella ashevillena]MDC0707395.1 penicillin-binding transpeptidase domain-containing protein [Stigmatella ashevillena]
MPRSQALLVTLLPLALVLGAMGTASTASEVPDSIESPDASVLAVEAALDAGTGEPDAGPPLLGLVPPAPVPARASAPPITQLRPLARKDDLLAQSRLSGGRLVMPPGKGGATLTVDPALQGQLTRIMQDYQVPYGAAVVIEPSSGRVLALAEHSQTDPSMRGLTTRAVFPAASIFKIVTGSALLEAGVSPTEESCFHGGKRGLTEKLLEDSGRDGACHTLSSAMGKSANVVFAKLTRKYLSADALRRMAARLRFNRPISFPIPTDVSLASIPEDEFGLANTGAGFGDVYLSPLHGAALAAASATGVWRDPVLFETVPDASVAPAEEVLSPEVTRALTGMLEETVTHGTARRIFRERAFRVEGAVGKTGTLADKNPFRDYSWFVGFAPKDHPRVAVAAVIVNEPLWRIRATWLGREAMRLALERFPAPVAPKQAPLVAEPTPPPNEPPSGLQTVSTAAAQEPEEAEAPALEEVPPQESPASVNASAPIP